MEIRHVELKKVVWTAAKMDADGGEKEPPKVTLTIDVTDPAYRRHQGTDRLRQGRSYRLGRGQRPADHALAVSRPAVAQASAPCRRPNGARHGPRAGQSPRKEPPMFTLVGRCARCGGNVAEEPDTYSPVCWCLQCGRAALTPAEVALAAKTLRDRQRHTALLREIAARRKAAAV